MSFEQGWSLPRLEAERVFEAVLAIADEHQLRFWGWGAPDGTIRVGVQFPIKSAAALAVSLSDLYDDADEVAEELEELEGELDWEAAEAAGVVHVETIGTTVKRSISPADERPFLAPAPTHYTCSFDVDWRREESGIEPVLVYSNENDNTEAWPVILAFTDAVVELLGGAWHER
jgi:hypothetical protein